MIRPPKKSIFKKRDIVGLRCLTKLCICFRPLNAHKFRRNVDSASPICTYNTGIGDDEHFLLHCPLFQNLRNNLFDKLSEIPEFNLNDISSEELCEVLLFGNSYYNQIAKIHFVN